MLRVRAHGIMNVSGRRTTYALLHTPFVDAQHSTSWSSGTAQRVLLKTAHSEQPDRRIEVGSIFSWLERLRNSVIDWNGRPPPHSHLYRDVCRAIHIQTVHVGGIAHDAMHNRFCVLQP